MTQTDEQNLPSVSIVVPSYNRPAYLQQALDSILAQKYPLSKIEVVVVDNASEESVLPLLAQYEHMTKNSLAGFKIVTRDTPVTTPAILYNAGIDEATGEILMFLDDDNLLDPYRVSASVVAVLPVDMVYTGMELFTGDNTNFDHEGNPLIPKPQSLHTIVVKEPDNPHPLEYIHPNDLVIKRYEMDFVGYFDEILHSSIAMEYVIRAGRAGSKISYLPMPLVRFRSHDNQRSAQPDYPSMDTNKSRPYIAGKETLMRKQLKVAIFGAKDPYMTSVLRRIPWLTVTDISHLPTWAQWHKIMDMRPNFVVCRDLLGATDQERRTFYQVPFVTIGLTHVASNQDRIDKGGSEVKELMEWYPKVNWYMTDHQEVIGKRDHIAFLPELPKDADEALAMWKNLMQDIRANRI